MIQVTSSTRPVREELLNRLEHLLKNQIAVTVLHMHQVAERLGRNATDLQCLHLLTLEGPCTAGRLAELAHLTTGAITAVVDRLEKAGYVRREPDPHDRRKVVITPVTERVERDISPHHADAAQTTEGIYKRYSDEDLAVIVDFFEQLAAMYRSMR